jgi:hypothetical protein
LKKRLFFFFRTLFGTISTFLLSFAAQICPFLRQDKHVIFDKKDYFLQGLNTLLLRVLPSLFDENAVFISAGTFELRAATSPLSGDSMYLL